MFRVSSASLDCNLFKKKSSRRKNPFCFERSRRHRRKRRLQLYHHDYFPFIFMYNTSCMIQCIMICTWYMYHHYKKYKYCSCIMLRIIARRASKLAQASRTTLHEQSWLTVSLEWFHTRKNPPKTISCHLIDFPLDFWVK